MLCFDDVYALRHNPATSAKKKEKSLQCREECTFGGIGQALPHALAPCPRSMPLLHVFAPCLRSTPLLHAFTPCTSTGASQANDSSVTGDMVRMPFLRKDDGLRVKEHQGKRKKERMKTMSASWRWLASLKKQHNGSNSAN